MRVPQRLVNCTGLHAPGSGAPVHQTLPSLRPGNIGPLVYFAADLNLISENAVFSDVRNRRGVSSLCRYTESIKIAGKWFEVPQFLVSPHAPFLHLRHRVSQILTALRMLDCEELQRAQIELLFGLQRRAALHSWPHWFR